MWYGILFSICTGLCWSCIGIVLSRFASKKLAVISYGFLQTLLTGIAALFLVDFKNIGLHDIYILLAFIFSAGVLNSLGQNTVHNAMKRGNHAPVWAISQSALIFPFLAGIIFFHNSGGAGQWIGTSLVATGILVPSAKDVKNVSDWFLPAITAFCIFGVVQILYSIPSQLYNNVNMAGARPLAAAWGGTAGWLLVAAYNKSYLHFDKWTLLIAGTMVLVQLLSFKVFFISLDTLSAANCGNIAFPLITGVNISGFAAYSILIRREKTSLPDKIGFGLVIAGLFCIAL